MQRKETSFPNNKTSRTSSKILSECLATFYLLCTGITRLIYIVGQLSQTKKFTLKFKVESSAALTESERDTVYIVIKLVHIIRSLLCGVISRLSGRGRREILVTGYECGIMHSAVNTVLRALQFNCKVSTTFIT